MLCNDALSALKEWSETLKEKPAAVPHGRACERTRTSAVKEGRLTTWAVAWALQTDADTLISEPSNTAHSCSQHRPSNWLTSQYVTTLPETFTLLAIHYRSALLGPFIKSPGQSIKQGTLHTEIHFAPLFKRNWRVLLIIQCFWNSKKTVGAACAELPSLPARLFTP